MANIPAPVYTGGGNQRGLGSSLLMTLAASAPQLLMQYLGMRQQTQDAEAQGQAATGVLADMVRNGTLSPEIFQSIGGQYTPAVAGVEGKTVAGTTTPSGLQTPTISMASRAAQPAQVNTAGINTRVAPQLLQQALATQESTTRTESAKASTAATIAGNEREAALHPLRVKQIQESIYSERFTRQAEGERLKLTKKQVDASIASDVERNRLAGEELRLRRTEAIQNVGVRLSSIHSDQMARFTTMAQLYASSGLAPDAARARASADVFGSTKPPKLDEFLQANTEKATAAILTGSDDPDSSLLHTVFGDRPDVEYGSKIGLQPEAIEFINQQLERNNGDGSSVLSAAAKTLTLEGEARDAELAKMMLYLSYKTGSKVAVPKEQAGGMRTSLARLLSMLDQGGIGRNIATGIGLAKSIRSHIGVEVTPEQRAQMDSGFVRGWAPPAR